MTSSRTIIVFLGKKLLPPLKVHKVNKLKDNTLETTAMLQAKLSTINRKKFSTIHEIMLLAVLHLNACMHKRSHSVRHLPMKRCISECFCTVKKRGRFYVWKIQVLLRVLPLYVGIDVNYLTFRFHIKKENLREQKTENMVLKLLKRAFCEKFKVHLNYSTIQIRELLKRVESKFFANARDLSVREKFSFVNFHLHEEIKCRGNFQLR